MYSRWKYFERSEFACKCCGKNLIVDQFVTILDEAREKAGVPFVINSGYRCEENNKTCGGSPTSSHLKGLAADIHCPSKDHKFKILKGVILAGIKRILIYRNFIHVDIDKSKEACFRIMS